MSAEYVDPASASDDFDAARTPMTARQAAGHLLRTGHALEGFYTYDGSGIYTLHRTCPCDAPMTESAP